MLHTYAPTLLTTYLSPIYILHTCIPVYTHLSLFVCFFLLLGCGYHAFCDLREGWDHGDAEHRPARLINQALTSRFGRRYGCIHISYLAISI